MLDYIYSISPIDGRYSEMTDYIKYIDIIVDGQYVDSLHDPRLKWRGSSNQRVIDVQKSLKNDKVELFCN